MEFWGEVKRKLGGQYLLAEGHFQKKALQCEKPLFFLEFELISKKRDLRCETFFLEIISNSEENNGLSLFSPEFKKFQKKKILTPGSLYHLRVLR